MMKLQVGDRLKQLRGGMSQAELAAILGVTKQTISNYETEVRVPPDAIKIKIARYFGKTVQEIFFD